MSGIASLSYNKDFAGSQLHASRNHNSFRHTYLAPGANRAQVDWLLTLRQNRKPLLASSASAPLLSESRPRGRDPLAPEHPDGPYHSETETVGKYQNFAASRHMVSGPRVSSGTAHSLDWHLNLRDGLHRDEFKSPGWRRHYARAQQSFDMLAENCSAGNEAFQAFENTPQDRRPDRSASALPCATIRDDPISFRRWPGCEGTNCGQWRHLLEDRRFGHKSKRQMRHEATLRETPGDPNGARITDNRSDGCLIEMLGKKRQVDIIHAEPLASCLPVGDPLLKHKYDRHPLPMADEENRALRMFKQPRHPQEASEEREPKAAMAF